VGIPIKTKSCGTRKAEGGINFPPEKPTGKDRGRNRGKFLIYEHGKKKKTKGGRRERKELKKNNKNLQGTGERGGCQPQACCEKEPHVRGKNTRTKRKEKERIKDGKLENRGGKSEGGIDHVGKISRTNFKKRGRVIQGRRGGG